MILNILSILTILIILLIVFVFGLIVGLYNNSNITSFLSFITQYQSTILAISTFALAVFTLTYVFLTNRILSLEHKPLIIIYLKRSVGAAGNPSISYIIRNIGKGPAYDISFEMLENKNKEFEDKSYFYRKIFNDGIEFLYPNQKTYFKLDLEPEINRKLSTRKIEIVANYKDLNKKNFTTKSVISSSLVEDEYELVDIAVKLGLLRASLDTTNDALGSINNTLKKEIKDK